MEVRDILFVLGMVAIGALIGGLTNYVAILMLFRPHSVKHIGRWRVPMTPGLIPKRKGEIARKLGEIVSRDLIRDERIREKLLQPNIKRGFISSIEKFLLTLKNDHRTIREFMDEQLKIESASVDAVERWIGLQGNRVIHHFSKKTFHEVLEELLKINMTYQLHQISETILKETSTYLASHEGKTSLENLIQDKLSTHGILGNMLSMFLGRRSLGDIIAPEIVKLTQSKEAYELVYSLLEAKWLDWKFRTVGEALKEWSEHGVDPTYNFINNTQFSSGILDQPVSVLFSNISVSESSSWLEKLVDLIILKVSEEIPRISRLINVAEIVEQEVNDFSTKRLEEMVISIANKELKLITILGAVLGGLIGVIQGMIALLI